MTTTTSHSPAIAAKGLRKAYGDKTVLDGIDLTVPAGTVFSLLGTRVRAIGRTDGEAGMAGTDEDAVAAAEDALYVLTA
ncbi:ABC transporter, partial [Streptomyces sp. NPDC058272]